MKLPLTVALDLSMQSLSLLTRIEQLSAHLATCDVVWVKAFIGRLDEFCAAYDATLAFETPDEESARRALATAANLRQRAAELAALLRTLETN